MLSCYNLALKFYSENKSEEEYTKCSKEIESFLDKYMEFNFFYQLTPEKLNTSFVKHTLEHESTIKLILENPWYAAIFDNYRFHQCDEIFGRGQFNIQLYKHALEKVFSKEEPNVIEQKMVQVSEKGSGNWLFLSVLLCLAVLGAAYLLNVGTGPLSIFS